MNKNTLEILSVSVSGGVFSLLLYENAKIEHGQDGFLLGKVEFNETKKLTDADHWVIQKESLIKIRSIVPCPQQFHFYDSSGKVNEEKIRNFLGHKETDVVGWYIYRPARFTMRLMLREKIIHRQLGQLFHLPVSHFSCCILMADWSTNKATCSLSQAFVRYNNGSYDGIPFHIINLSDPMCTYKNGENPSAVVNEIIKRVKDSGAVQGHLLVKNVQEILQKKIKDLVLKVVEKEQVLFQLEKDVKKLDATLKKDVCDAVVIGNGLLQNSCEYKKVPEDRLKHFLNSSI